MAEDRRIIKAKLQGTLDILNAISYAYKGSVSISTIKNMAKMTQYDLDQLEKSKLPIVHKAQGGYPHPTLCGQYITMGFHAAEKDSEITCSKCLRRLQDGKKA